jgi:hypothetical protein
MPANTSDKYTWNDRPPNGHPMEPGDFPGPAYPPDHAKGPSPKSPFHVALKRAMAHIGAWPWDPDSWDEAWSNAAAHGVDGNPNKAGMQAVQLWSGTIDPTGNVGEKTFNFLRSVIIPQGRTHAGEPAWDSVCQQLTAQAYDAAHPKPPSKLIRLKALELAQGEIGYLEGGNNDNKYGAWYGENYVSYCAIGVTWAYLNAGHPVGMSFQTVKQAGQNDRHDYVPYVVSDARAGRYGFSVTNDPQPGDVVAYNWGGSAGADPYYYDHVGLFESWVSGHAFQAVEFNTTGSSGGNQSNGGGVYRKQRDVNGQGTTFIRVREPA